MRGRIKRKINRPSYCQRTKIKYLAALRSEDNDDNEVIDGEITCPEENTLEE